MAPTRIQPFSLHLDPWVSRRLRAAVVGWGNSWLEIYTSHWPKKVIFLRDAWVLEKLSNIIGFLPYLVYMTGRFFISESIRPVSQKVNFQLSGAGTGQRLGGRGGLILLL